MSQEGLSDEQIKQFSGISEHAMSVTDWPVTRQKSVTFDNKAKVRALVQRAQAFKKQKLAEEADEELADVTDYFRSGLTHRL
jgi:hypothetical protein